MPTRIVANSSVTFEITTPGGTEREVDIQFKYGDAILGLSGNILVKFVLIGEFFLKGFYFSPTLICAPEILAGVQFFWDEDGETDPSFHWAQLPSEDTAIIVDDCFTIRSNFWKTFESLLQALSKDSRVVVYGLSEEEQVALVNAWRTCIAQLSAFRT